MRTIALSLALFISVHALAGDPVKLREAFKKSYVAENRGDLAASIKALTDVYDDSDYGINLRLGWLHYSAGAFTESQGFYQKAIDLMPASVEARLGMLYPAVALGQWDKVARQYEEILKVDPKNTKALYNLGLIVYGKAQYDKALSYFSTGLNLYPFDYDFNVMTAWTSYRMGKMREAKVLFEKALTIAPDDASSLEGLELVK